MIHEVILIVNLSIFCYIVILLGAVLKKADAKSDVSEKNEEIDVSELPKGCQMPKLSCTDTKGSCFWIEGWRTALCTCDECKSVRY